MFQIQTEGDVGASNSDLWRRDVDGPRENMTDARTAHVLLRRAGRAPCSEFDAAVTRVWSTGDSANSRHWRVEMGARGRDFREVVMMVVEQTKIGGGTSFHTGRSGFVGSTPSNPIKPEGEPGNRSAVRALFLISPSTTPCGVEMFARRLARTWTDIGLVKESVVIRGDVHDIFAVWKALDVADAVVMNFPIVAWKRVLLTPLLAFGAALARGEKRFSSRMNGTISIGAADSS
jgi:hypothetical protein